VEDHGKLHKCFTIRFLPNIVKNYYSNSTIQTLQFKLYNSNSTIQTLQFKLYNSNSTLLELAMFSGYPAECIEKGKKVIVKLIKL
jgi:hypothetical protein